MALPTKPGNNRRGWNDPPVLLHDASAAMSNQQMKPALTNPMQLENSAGGIVLLPPASTAEPRPSFVAPVIVPMLINPSAAGNEGDRTSAASGESQEASLPSFESDEQLYHFVTTRLWRALSDCQSVTSEKESKDIAGKINVIQTMWQSGRLSYPVKAGMARLVTALHRRQCDLAHDIHVCLLMDYSSEVGSWMIGVKRLINAARGVDAPLSPTDMTQYLAPASQEDVLSTPGHVSHPNSEAGNGQCDRDGLLVNDDNKNCDSDNSRHLSESTADAATEDDSPQFDCSPDTPQATPSDLSGDPIDGQSVGSASCKDATISQVVDKLEDLYYSADTPQATPDEPEVHDEEMKASREDLNLSQVADRLQDFFHSSGGRSVSVSEDAVLPPQNGACHNLVSSARDVLPDVHANCNGDVIATDGALSRNDS